MHGDVQVVTPELASEWLRKSNGNRSQREASIKMYAQDMAHNRWRLTHQGIAFDESGVLIDGHHRLNAVMRSGVPVKMFVVRSVPENAKANIDTNMARRARDTYAIVTGSRVDNQVTAICMCIEVVPDFSNPKIPYSREQQMQLIEQHREAAEYANQIRTAHVPRFNKGGRTAIARAWYTCRESGEMGRLDEFVQVLKTGVPKGGEGDTAALALFRYVTTRVQPGASSGVVLSLYRRTQTAIHRFMLGQPAALVKETHQDLFPLSDDNRVVN